MSRLRALLTGISGLLLLISLLGCEGDTGLTGPRGTKGRKGESGSDPERMLSPTPRYLSLGIVNGSIHALTATEPLYVIFDTTLHPDGDTIVANRLSIPPLLDGVDGGVTEWGNHKSVLRLSPQTLDSSGGEIPDPHIYKATCRVGFDDDYLYMFLRWKEITVARDPRSGTSAPTISTGDSRGLNTLFLDISHPVVATHTENGITSIDTIFTNLRIRQLVTLDSICFPPPPLPPIICDHFYDTTYDTLLVWKTLNGEEDKAVVCWSMQESVVQEELHQFVFVTDSAALPSASADELVDLWRWGAATSELATIADDWSIRSGKVLPDEGQAPFISNWMQPDSFPRFMNRLDPNHITNWAHWVSIYPMWYYDVVAYTPRGWADYAIIYVPGVVATIPSHGRADVTAHGLFAEDYWTLELKRARKTGNGDDLQF